MFAILATKPLNDGTKGFRFNILGTKGFIRKRLHKSRGWFTTTSGDTFNQKHFGKLTIAIEKNTPAMRLGHFAG